MLFLLYKLRNSKPVLKSNNFIKIFKINRARFIKYVIEIYITTEKNGIIRLIALLYALIEIFLIRNQPTYITIYCVFFY